MVLILNEEIFGIFSLSTLKNEISINFQSIKINPFIIVSFLYNIWYVYQQDDYLCII